MCLPQNFLNYYTISKYVQLTLNPEMPGRTGKASNYLTKNTQIYIIYNYAAIVFALLYYDAFYNNHSRIRMCVRHNTWLSYEIIQEDESQAEIRSKT